MANPLRGEISAELGGRPHTLCLTLGALAELEGALECDDLGALAARFREARFSAGDLIAIVGAGLRGAGHDISNTEVGALASSGGIAGYVDIVARLLAATFALDEAGADAKKNR